MNLGRRGKSDDGDIPVFVFPYSLTFYADDPNSHAQTLRIYNPYPYHIQFKVLSNATTKYEVHPSEKNIRPLNFEDILIRIKAVHPHHYGQTDTFRFVVNKVNQSQRLGKRDIKVTLYPTKKDDHSSTEAEKFEQTLPILPFKNKPAHQFRIVDSTADRTTFAGSKVVFIVAAVICMLALMLPTQGLDKSDYPSYLHLTVSQKLIVGYILGLLTLVILQN